VLAWAPSTRSSAPGLERWWRSLGDTVCDLGSHLHGVREPNRPDYIAVIWKGEVRSLQLFLDGAYMSSDWRLISCQRITSGSVPSGSIGEAIGAVDGILCILEPTSRVRDS